MKFANLIARVESFSQSANQLEWLKADQRHFLKIKTIQLVQPMVLSTSKYNTPLTQSNNPACSEAYSGLPPTSKLDHQIQTCLEHARRITQMTGDTSVEAAIAWDTVEELLAYKADQRQKPRKSAFERYCTQNPDAPECRIYDL